MIKKLPWRELLVVAVVLAAGAGVFLYAHRADGRLEESKQRGAAIVAALHEFRVEAGTYPETLEDLVPRHLAEVQPPTWGLERWRYRRYTAADVATAPDPTQGDTIYFQLSVAAHESGYPILYYDLAARRWVLNN